MKPVDYKIAQELKARIAQVAELIDFRVYGSKARGDDDDYSGYSNEGRPLHVLCGNLEEDELLIITAYEPNPDEWEIDLKTRKRGG